MLLFSELQFRETRWTVPGITKAGLQPHILARTCTPTHYHTHQEGDNKSHKTDTQKWLEWSLKTGQSSNQGLTTTKQRLLVL